MLLLLYPCPPVFDDLSSGMSVGSLYEIFKACIMEVRIFLSYGNIWVERRQRMRVQILPWENVVTPWKGESFIEWWRVSIPREKGSEAGMKGKNNKERQNGEHILLVAAVELDLWIKISKLCFPVAMFLSAPWGSKLVNLLNSGRRQTVSLFSRST